MSAIDQLFCDLRANRRKAFMPFITAGDPSLDVTQAIIQQLAAHGCHLCEVGIPYSDPIADGPVIQASYTRALDKHVKLDAILEMLKQTSSQVSMPLVTMVSYAIVYRHGLERYVADAKAAGLAGLIVPDLLVEEAPPLAELCRQADISLIQLVTPTTSRERAIQIAQTSTGFLYYVSVTGITGARQELPSGVVDQVAWLREQTELPICIGFGISRPEHVRTLVGVADGVIVGSALVRYLERLTNEPRAQVEAEMMQLVDSLLAALNS
ncbi:MAG: tryptophan synthase subunit alpha [Planctomycetales bacterium]|nr:tryptophan synthase subunit alpha [Planctomycetales bacterium]